MNLEPITQNEVSQKEKNKYILTHIYGIQKDGTGEPFYRTMKETDTKNNLVNTVGEEEDGTNGNSSVETYILSYVKQIASGNLLYDAESSNLKVCDNLEGWDRVGERFKRGERMYICG